MSAYYNEKDPFAAQWLRNLIAAGLIAPGFVDERSIEDVTAQDLAGYTQCHFFAGVGVWSYALRLAGWRDDWPVWTASCPCQPFSAAGEGAGFADERHLWPAFYHLASQCKPPIVFGEQVASKDADAWIDLVQADMEAMGYAFGAVPFPSASVGGPHIRDRLYWMADADSRKLDGVAILRGVERDRKDAGRAQSGSQLEPRGNNGGLGHADDTRLERHARYDRFAGWRGTARPTPASGVSGGLADLHGDGCDQAGQGVTTAGNDGAIGNGAASGLEYTKGCGRSGKSIRTARGGPPIGVTQGSDPLRPGPLNGFWRDADWIFCRDERWRPVEPGSFPLVDGAASRVGRLRAYGNAINAEAARVFIESFIEGIVEEDAPANQVSAGQLDFFSGNVR